MPSDTLYTVRRSDTLGRIAARFERTVQAIVDANAAKVPSLLTNPGMIQAGWELTIPSASGGRDDVLFVGMNPTASVELGALRKGGARVVDVGDSPEGADKLRVGGVVHDLATAEGALAFARTLGLTTEQTGAVARVLFEALPDARDELGRIAEVWAEAEKGGAVPSRLVLSGHSVGTGVWGDENGTLTLDSLGELAAALPAAARAVEDVHVSGCYSGGRYVLLRIQAIFPHAKTIWAYAGSAPGAHSGATAHQALWERATRGEASDVDRAVVDGTRKGDNVVVWSIGGGYEDAGGARPIEALRIDLAYFQPVYELYTSGDMAVDNPQTGQLRDYYDALQALLAHPELPADERAELEARRDHTIRLLYYRATVAQRFTSNHWDEIRRGYASLGTSAPDFSALSRREALAQIDAFTQRARASGAPEPAQSLANLLERGLRDLDPTIIPNGWV
jgi:hypothetical protein